MKAFLDTSVLIATFYGDHEHHVDSKNLFLRFEKNEVCCAAHSLPEVYSVLTGMPGKNRVSGDEALLFLGDIQERLSIVALNDKEYFKAVESAAAADVCGGGIYDAVLAYCALKSNADKIFTWNLKDFSRLGSEIAARAITP